MFASFAARSVSVHIAPVKRFHAAPVRAPVSATATMECARVGHATRTNAGRCESLEVTMSLDGSGRFQGSTNDAFIDQLVSRFAAHSGFDVTARATTSSSCTSDRGAFAGEVLGLAFLSAVGYARMDRQRMRRTGAASASSDDAFAHVSVEMSDDNRTYLGIHDARNTQDEPSEAPSLDVSIATFRFMCTFANEARLMLHILLIAGVFSRAVAYAEVKALGIALKSAVREV